MRRVTKNASPRALQRKAGTPLLARQAAPAWIDAEQGLAFTTSVTRRVRAGLPLRAMPGKKPLRPAKVPHARRRG